MSLQVEKITSKEELDFAFAIREKVFVFEQEVDPAAEYDKFEDSSSHFLAKLDGKPVGTARWRYTSNGVKLERFAVLQEARGKGVGQGLVRAVLNDIASQEETKEKIKYLHAQLLAVPLYAKFGFEKVGDIFEECNILHYKMQLK
ncbi:GNAT family N-acetyltransferase [Algoriphagus sp. CAU 1675]|uniref:GNAT family N-acetyltransferase n=1 Tax=Algoriphagus sp. CAU 1675 TaxID=3032597 RepID=UPI0023DB6DBF|nr:GNAT family N-acetyltransferase [Algoriphagus sp. CAU 1675]MDF2159035.1 GNAT family N-acetyltransferase [Algoriphagus sp. CAU 1675]